MIWNRDKRRQNATMVREWRAAKAHMLPYLRPSEVKIGPLTFHAFGALVMIAVLAGAAIVAHRAERLGFPRKVASRLYIWMMVSGFAGAHVAKTIEEGTLWADPLALLRVWNGLYSFGGIVGGLLGILCFARWYRLPRTGLWQFLDVVAYSFPFAWIFGRLGCSFAHDHPGTRTTSWLGVPFPDGRRFDLGLLEFLFTILVAAAFLVLDRQLKQEKRPTGFYFALLLLLYGPFRFFLDGLHVERPHGYLSPDGCFAIAAMLTGLAALVMARRAA